MFKNKFLILTLALAIAVPLMAQGTRPLRGLAPAIRQRLQQRPGRGEGFKPADIQKELNLTPDQVNALKSIVQSNKEKRQALAQDARQKAQALRDTFGQSKPNPTDVGNAALALKQVRNQAQELRQQTLERFKAFLTPDQVKTLEDLQARRRGGQ